MSNEAIAAVNHWRGQCLDNFARAEKAVIAASEAPALKNLEKPLVLHEAAANRTRALAHALRSSFANNPLAIKAASRLQGWGLREKQRNRLVHGCFKVKGNADENWSLVIESVEVKKGVAVTNHLPLSRLECDAFLTSVIAERKDLEDTLKAVATGLQQT